MSLASAIEALSVFAEQPGMQDILNKLAQMGTTTDDLKTELVDSLKAKLTSIHENQANHRVIVGNLSLSDAAYDCFLYLSWPIPRNENDPISLEPIEPENAFLSSDGNLYDITQLGQWIASKKEFVDPLINLKFKPIDQLRIQRMCANKTPPIELALPRATQAPLLRQQGTQNQATFGVEGSTWNNPQPLSAGTPPNTLAVRYILTQIKYSQCISDLYITQLGDGNFKFYVTAGLYDEIVLYSQRSLERNERFMNALIRADFVATMPACTRFPNGSEYLLMFEGDARTIQDILVRVIEVIKQLEGNTIFGDQEEMLLNLTPSVTPGMQMRNNRPL